MSRILLKIVISWKCKYLDFFIPFAMICYKVFVDVKTPMWGMLSGHKDQKVMHIIFYLLCNPTQ